MLCLALLHLPLQITSALWQSVQGSAFTPGREPDMEQLALSLALSGATFLFGLAVFFVFPFIQGGVLGQVRDRLEFPSQPAGTFGAYGRAHYTRLLGSQALFALVAMAAILPVVILAAALAMQEVEELGGLPEPGQLDRSIPRHPVMLAIMVVAMAVVSVAGVVYWMANCIVVAEREGTVAAWRRAFAFCRRNAGAVLSLWLVNLVVGLVLAPLGMLGQWKIVTAWWALAALAVLQAAVTGYWGVVLAGMCMSVYLDRRTPVEDPEPADALARVEP
jgi:hypothetical protein